MQARRQVPLLGAQERACTLPGLQERLVLSVGHLERVDQDNWFTIHDRLFPDLVACHGRPRPWCRTRRARVRRVELGGAQSCREPVHPGRLLLVDRLVPGAAALGQGAAMVGAVSRWVPSSRSLSTSWATSARLMESRMVTGRRCWARSVPVARPLVRRAGRIMVQSRSLAVTR